MGQELDWAQVNVRTSMLLLDHMASHPRIQQL